MKISEFVADVRSYTDWAVLTSAESGWVLVNGVYGPSPVYAIDGPENWRSSGRIFTPMQLVTVGWEEAHDRSLWDIKPRQDAIMEALGFTEKQYRMVDAACCDLKPYNRRLRTDLLAACDLEEP